MKKYLLLFTLILSGVAGSAQQASLLDSGSMPTVFAPGIISTPYSEWATSFSPDGQTVYSSLGAIYWTIVYSKLKDGQWQKPAVASFSGRFRDTDPFITPNGKRIFFISSRPQANAPQDHAQRAMHIWYADALPGDQWSNPVHLDSAININDLDNYAPSVSALGNLYFCSRNRNGHAGMQGYTCRWAGDHYEKPVLLTIGGVSEIQDPFIAPDERYLIFLSGNDLYLSLRQNNGWSTPQKLGVEVNNGDNNSSPCISPDGKMLYYSSQRIQGFYKRDIKNQVTYDELLKENSGLFNYQGNILMIPIHLPKT
jgi:Tol biopolymer transport system component